MNRIEKEIQRVQEALQCLANMLEDPKAKAEEIKAIYQLIDDTLDYLNVLKKKPKNFSLKKPKHLKEI
jgi:hypothetical protein